MSSPTIARERSAPVASPHIPARAIDPGRYAPDPVLVVRPAARERGGPRLPYLPGLDGLRAVAVLAVLGYHLEFSWMRGGFLGVDIFFVLSGYLITALLLREWQEHSRIDLKTFLRRRARRLLPAVFALVGAVTVFTALAVNGEMPGLRADVLASLTYVFNWFQVVGDQSYFESVGRPSPFSHLWSLAVEEQFYLLWPVLFVAGMVLLGRRRFLVAVLCGVVLSVALAWILLDPNDPSRVYYGTDTRASTLLIGAALALVWAPWRLRGTAGRHAPVVLDAVGLVALVALGWQLVSRSEFDTSLYRGNLALIALMTAVVVAVSAHPASRLGRVMGVAPLRWIGVRSYGIYLWHWPVFVMTRPDFDVPFDGPALFMLRMTLTFALVEVSYRYVELPIRNGALGRLRARYRTAHPVRRAQLRLRWTVLSSTAFASLFLLVVAAGPSSVERPPMLMPVSDASSVQGGLMDSASPALAGAVDAVTSGGASGADAKPSSTKPEDRGGVGAALGTAVVDAGVVTPPAFPKVTALGDSVMLGAAAAIQNALGAEATVDAAVGRQVDDGIEILRSMAEAGTLGDVVVIQLGNNGPFRAEQFDALMAAVGADQPVVFLNVSVPRRWEGQVNEIVGEGVKRHPNATLLDWKAQAGTPDTLWKDGVHLTSTGAGRYAEAIKAAASAAPAGGEAKPA